MHIRLNNKCLKLFECCLLVKGSRRSLICDVQRNDYKFIPNDLYDILIEYDGKSIETLKSNFAKTEHPVLEEYLSFLEKNEFIFWCDPDEIDLFPEIDLNWDVPSTISNTIIDIDEFSSHDLSTLIPQFEVLNCQDIQIRSYTKKNISFWKDFLVLTKTSKIKNIEIITQWDEEYDYKEIFDLTRLNLRLRAIIFHSSSINKIIRSEDSKGGSIIIILDKIDNYSHCGQIHLNYFSANIKHFTEAQKHNTCLNRKISIDVNGEIKNCPSMAKSYGNIKDTTLAEAIEKPGFKDLWFINKDQIDVCKDCEFRYICTDCRAYLENPEDIYSKPLKCGYNPYTAEWEEWSTNPLKQKAIEYYGMQELVKKEK